MWISEKNTHVYLFIIIFVWILKAKSCFLVLLLFSCVPEINSDCDSEYSKRFNTTLTWPPFRRTWTQSHRSLLHFLLFFPPVPCGAWSPQTCLVDSEKEKNRLTNIRLSRSLEHYLRHQGARELEGSDNVSAVPVLRRIGANVGFEDLLAILIAPDKKFYSFGLCQPAPWWWRWRRTPRCQPSLCGRLCAKCTEGTNKPTNQKFASTYIFPVLR